MKTQYKFIYFLKTYDLPKTSVWHLRSRKSDDLLGEVKWYGPWRQYCYFAMNEAVYSVGCLEDINDFIRQLEEERKKE